jgi:hypothetical protein
MTDDDKIFQEQLAQLRQESEKVEKLETLKNDTAEKRVILDSRRVASELERQEQDLKDLEAINNANYAELSEQYVAQLQQDQEDYINAARNGMTFINEEFVNIVPFFRKNIILVGSKSGDGKSTVAANIVYSTLKQRSPVTGKPGKVLMLSNEENPGDVYSRVVCLEKGWAYTNHKKFGDEQTQAFKAGIKGLAKGGKLTVLDNTYNGAHGVTTSPEGIKAVLDNLIKNNVHYDCIILDYYQNVIFSKENAKLTEYDAQAKLCRILDQYKNIISCPIVILSQMEPPTEKYTKPYQMRIMGRKLIVTQATFIVEITANRENGSTEWVVHKSRFTESVGRKFLTGYKLGRYVKWDDAFQSEVQRWKDDMEAKKFNKDIGLKDVFDKKEDDNVPE